MFPFEKALLSLVVSLAVCYAGPTNYPYAKDVSSISLDKLDTLVARQAMASNVTTPNATASPSNATMMSNNTTPMPPTVPISTPQAPNGTTPAPSITNTASNVTTPTPNATTTSTNATTPVPNITNPASNVTTLAPNVTTPPVATTPRPTVSVPVMPVNSTPVATTPTLAPNVTTPPVATTPHPTVSVPVMPVNSTSVPTTPTLAPAATPPPPAHPPPAPTAATTTARPGGNQTANNCTLGDDILHILFNRTTVMNNNLTFDMSVGIVGSRQEILNALMDNLRNHSRAEIEACLDLYRIPPEPEGTPDTSGSSHIIYHRPGHLGGLPSLPVPVPASDNFDSGTGYSTYLNPFNIAQRVPDYRTHRYLRANSLKDLFYSVYRDFTRELDLLWQHGTPAFWFDRNAAPRPPRG